MLLTLDKRIIGSMQPAAAYIASDRRQLMATGQTVPQETIGATLFADISGFTQLTSALVRAYGPRRGAEELTRQLNVVYTALISEVERYGGSVLGFSGDAITCWFTAPASTTASSSPEAGNLPVNPSTVASAVLYACTAALAMQQVMKALQIIRLQDGTTVTLAIKIAVTAGPVRRFAVGDPTIQLIDVLAGATLDRMAATEQMAQQGELLLDAPTAASIADTATITEWRTNPSTAERFAVVTALQHIYAPVEQVPATMLPESEVSAWVLPPVYARLQNEGGRFLAELRPAVALFLKFTGLDYDCDLAAAEKLRQYIGWVQGVINRYEGALIQLTTGDKGSYLYAAFGAPIAHDDDLRRAAMAALELRTPPTHCPFITSIQIGISQGAMRVGAYGSNTRRTYGVLGDETVVAARLMSHAAPGQVVVSQIVADALEHEFQYQTLGEFQLKGKPAPQPLYALIQPMARARQLLDLYPTPLVGRTTELATVTAELNIVQQGQGRLVRIEGSAGVGKSHLVAAVAQQAMNQGFGVIIGACQSTNQDTAYAAIRLAMRALVGLDTIEALSVDAQIAHVTATITAINPAWALRLPLLRDLLTLPIPDNATTAAFDARLRYEALISLVVDLVQSYAQRQALLLLFEDIHWMDEASQGVTLALARMLHTVPLLLLLVQRPPVREHEPFLYEIATLAPQLHLHLEELTPTGIAALVQQRLDRVASATPISPLALSLIQAQTQGNPFFAEELIDAMLDSAHLQQQDNRWHLAPSITQRLRNSGCLTRLDGQEVVATGAPLSTVELGMPSTIQGVILARLDRLPEPVKLTLKVASVIGRVFEYDLLVRAHPVAKADVLLVQQLETLLQRDFARLESPKPRRTYLFKHNITQEVVYQTLLTDQRQELHLAVAKTLEGLQPDNVEDLALHFYNSDLHQHTVRSKALHYLDAAGLRAKHDYANETALSYFNRALAVEERPSWLQAKVEVLHILGRRDEEAVTLHSLAQQQTTSQFDLALLWGKYYAEMSDYTQAATAIQQALDLAKRSADQEGQARCLARLGMLAWRQGINEEAEQLYRAGLAMVEDIANYRSVEAEVRYGLGLVYRQQGKFHEAWSAFERDLVLNQQLDNLQFEARARNALGGIEHLQKNFHEAIRYYQQALVIREQIGDRAGVGASLLNIAQNFSALGNYHEAEPMLREALQIQKALNNQWWQAITFNELGILQFTIGNLVESRRSLEQGLALDQEGIQSYLLCNLGQVLRDMNELRSAEEVLRKGWHLAQTQGDIHLEAIYLNDLALVSLYNRNFTEANKQAQTSLEKFENLQLELSITCNLAIIAAAQAALNNRSEALTTVHKALQILDACDGEGPDFPQRDYWMCYEVLQTLGETTLATQALSAAHRLLMRQAERINDAAMRHSYLENVTFNRNILQAVNTKILVV